MIKDKTIIVTGAARGLGQNYALEFAKAEANIIFADISDCSETEKKVSEVTDKFLSLNLDVTDINSCNNMMAKAVDKFSKIDVLVNNAALYGALKSSRFEDIDPDQWDKAMNVNVKGLWNCCRAISPIMRENKSGSIINIASLAAKFGMPYAADYATSKAAVIGLTRVMAREMGKDNIRVNAILPGLVDGDRIRRVIEAKSQQRGLSFADVEAEALSFSSIKDYVSPQHLADQILLLASTRGRMISGQALSIDGDTKMLM